MHPNISRIISYDRNPYQMHVRNCLSDLQNPTMLWAKVRCPRGPDTGPRTGAAPVGLQPPYEAVRCSSLCNRPNKSKNLGEALLESCYMLHIFGSFVVGFSLAHIDVCKNTVED